MLVIYNPHEPFVVCCDASMLGLGSVLMQNGPLVAYATKQVTVCQHKYTTHDLELADVVFALKVLRHFLYYSKFNVFGDHKRLQ